MGQKRNCNGDYSYFDSVVFHRKGIEKHKKMDHIDHFKEKETRKNDADLFFRVIIKTNLVDLFEL